MRILCVHGMGCSADIFRAQTGTLRSLLPSTFSYVFIDGEFECPAPEGIHQVYPPPYLCFYPVPTTTNIQEAFDLMDEVIDEQGPFDGILGFSQGGALAASFLLHHEKQQPHAPPPFRLAIFLCTSLPYSVDASEGVDVAALFAKPKLQSHPKAVGVAGEVGGMGSELITTTYDPRLDDGSAAARPLQFFPLPLQTVLRYMPITKDDRLASTSSSMSPTPPLTDTEEEEEEEEDPFFSDICNSSIEETNLNTAKAEAQVKQSQDFIIRRLHPEVEKTRVTIPMVHVYGRNDPYYTQSRALVQLCDPAWTTVYEHCEGHNVPRNQRDISAIVGAVEKGLGMCNMMQ